MSCFACIWKKIVQYVTLVGYDIGYIICCYTLEENNNIIFSMKSKIIYIIFICLLVGILFCTCVQKDQRYILQGDYLGQEVPGLQAKLFAPGILSTKMHDDAAPAFTSNNKEVYFRICENNKGVIFFMRRKNDIWEPRM